jgi:hypothetical protein
MKYVLIPVAKAAKLFLTGCIPDIEQDWSKVGVELERADLDPHGCEVALLKFSRDVSLHKSGLADATITYKHDLERRDSICGRCHRSAGSVLRSGD